MKYVDPSGYVKLKTWDEFQDVVNNLMETGGSWNSETGYSYGNQGGGGDYGIPSGSGFQGPGQPGFCFRVNCFWVSLWKIKVLFSSVIICLPTSFISSTALNRLNSLVYFNIALAFARISANNIINRNPEYIGQFFKHVRRRQIAF